LLGEAGGWCEGDGERVEDGLRNRRDRPFGFGRIKRYVTVERSAG